jgi:uncharacterized membrane protein YqhA
MLQQTATRGEDDQNSAAQSLPLPPASPKSLVEIIFEKALWSSRLIVLLAVFASLLVALGVFLVISVDATEHLSSMGRYATGISWQERTEEGKHEREVFRAETIAHVVEVIDGYLLGAMMLIFSFGLYELFISSIDPAKADDRSARILLISSLDDLKHRLGQVVILILSLT